MNLFLLKNTKLASLIDEQKQIQYLRTEAAEKKEWIQEEEMEDCWKKLNQAIICDMFSSFLQNTDTLYLP